MPVAKTIFGRPITPHKGLTEEQVRGLAEAWGKIRERERLRKMAADRLKPKRKPKRK